MNKLISPWIVKKKFNEKATIVIYNGDATKFLDTIPREKISLVVSKHSILLSQMLVRAT